MQRHARVRPVTQPIDLSELRWTLDTADDHRIIAAIYDELDPVDPSFDSRDVYRLLLRRPELIHLQGQGEPSPAERDRLRGRIEAHLKNLGEATR